jgi:hypothetical protein
MAKPRPLPVWDRQRRRFFCEFEVRKRSCEPHCCPYGTSRLQDPRLRQHTAFTIGSKVATRIDGFRRFPPQVISGAMTPGAGSVSAPLRAAMSPLCGSCKSTSEESDQQKNVRGGGKLVKPSCCVPTPRPKSLTHRLSAKTACCPTKDRGRGKEGPAVAICATLRAPRY